ncbi:MAG TPA: ribosome biogenesis GTPase Der [Thermohalobaculum sp.]|nr:ribosome biogenesis GTPase Der [Thermohalobaculum sp.]
MSLTVAIIGRPNVGKSTLFNRLVGKRLALVDDQPGVTRDLREGSARLGDLAFRVIDTAGLEEVEDASLPGRMRKLTERAIDEADLCLFLIDARAGVTPTDEVLAELLRKREAAVILAANKAEGRAGEAGMLEAYALGLGEPLALSAEHGEGMGELHEVLAPHVARATAAEASREREVLDDPLAENRPLQIAVIGRPNVGKSTLVNRLLGEERLLTGPEAGITRDAISVELRWRDRPFRVFDTAGLRKKARVQERVEKLSTGDTLRAARFAEVVILLMDAENALETQDLRIADLAEREGRAVVVALNKWDAVEGKQATLRELRRRFEELLPQLKGAPVIPVSAKTGQGLDKLGAAVLEMHGVWNRRVTTGELNRWLAARLEEHPPPAPSGRRIRLRFMTQVKARPPSFVVFCSRPEALPQSYTRFLVNGLRRDFGLHGVPIRLALRKGENPYKRR